MTSDGSVVTLDLKPSRACCDIANPSNRSLASACGLRPRMAHAARANAGLCKTFTY